MLQKNRSQRTIVSNIREYYSLTHFLRNLFILHEATGGNPFEIDKIREKPIEKYKHNKVVKKYYKLINEFVGQFQDFGKKYVY